MSRLKSVTFPCAKCSNEVLDEDLCPAHFSELITHESVPVADEPDAGIIGIGQRTCKHCGSLYDVDLGKWCMCPVRLRAWQLPRWQRAEARRSRIPNPYLDDYLKRKKNPPSAA